MVRIDYSSYNILHDLLNFTHRLNLFNASCNDSTNESCMDVSSTTDFETEKVFWALLLIPLPLVAVVGNILVILSIYKEKSLQTVTNYFIVSLAFADLLVAAVVMPFAVYVLVNVEWELSDTLCDFYIAVDVTCSTASIFNLVAISIDRYIAVTQPIKYSKHRNNKRVFLTIAIVWLVSAAIGSPIVLGLNTSPERIPQLCVFYNSDFIIYSSLSSFYIPCIVMVFLYYKIFRAIHERAKKNKKRAAAGNRPHLGTPPSGTPPLDSNSKPPPHHHQQRRAQITKDPVQKTLHVVVETDAVTTTNNSQLGDEDMDEEDTEDARPVVNGDDQHPLTKSSNKVIMRLTTLSNSSKSDDSSQLETQFNVDAIQSDSPNDSPRSNSLIVKEVVVPKKNGILVKTKKNNHLVTSTTGVVVVEVKKKKSRFNLGKRHKSSSKKREKASAKRERKATKTLAIVLGMFLMCWVPFFTCNILDAICIKLETDTWRPGMTIFLLTTWLGYINSCVNPVIYTIFNLEFRKAFKKLLQGMCVCQPGSSK